MSPSRWTRNLFKRSIKTSSLTANRGPESSQSLDVDSVDIELSSQTMNSGEIFHQSPSQNKLRARFNETRPDKLRMNFCITCFRDLPESEFPGGRILESCYHKSVICLDCLEESVVESLNVHLPQVVGCPQCGVTMSANDVWRFSRARISER